MDTAEPFRSKAGESSSETGNPSTLSGSPIGLFRIKYVVPKLVHPSGPSVFCTKCSTEHPPDYSICPSHDCSICYHYHYTSYCPYFDELPKGAAFNDRYEVVCQCGDVFDVDKWVCTFCGGSRVVLQEKVCIICDSYGQHSTYVCPK
ncbi:hypothetical protein OROGR_031824 [Orobanche gracilis]